MRSARGDAAEAPARGIQTGSERVLISTDQNESAWSLAAPEKKVSGPGARIVGGLVPVITLERNI